MNYRNDNDKMLERRTVLKRNQLDGKEYFGTLITAGIGAGLLTPEQAEDIEVDALLILAECAKKYDSDSSSLPVEVAQELLSGVLYTVGLALKEYPEPDDAIEELKKGGFPVLYKKGQELSELLRSRALDRYALLFKLIPDIPCRVFNDTLRDGLTAFFDKYDTELFPDNPIISCDYPLCREITGLTGAERIDKYIEHNYYECLFLRCFDENMLCRFFEGTIGDYSELVINLFTPVYAAALACEMVGVAPQYLSLDENAFSRISELVKYSDENELYAKAYTAAKSMLMKIALLDEYATVYVLECLPQAIMQIRLAVNNGKADELALNNPFDSKAEPIVYDYGTQTDGKFYRKVLAEVNARNTSKEKADTVFRLLHSLYDLENILMDAELSDRDVTEILSRLQSYELAALVKHFPFDDDFIDERKDEEKLLSEGLHNYINSLSTEQKSEIIELCSRIKE